MSNEQSIRDEEERPVIELARVIASWDQGIDMSHRIPHWAVNLAMHLREQGYSRPVSPQGPTEADAAFAWAEYRHDIEPNRRSLGRESVAFKAGWNAALRRGAPAEPAVIRRIQAEAWHKGHSAGIFDKHYGTSTRNPYTRKEQS